MLNQLPAEKAKDHQHHGGWINGIQEWNGDLQKSVQAGNREHTMENRVIHAL